MNLTTQILLLVVVSAVVLLVVTFLRNYNLLLTAKLDNKIGDLVLLVILVICIPFLAIKSFFGKSNKNEDNSLFGFWYFPEAGVVLAATLTTVFIFLIVSAFIIFFIIDALFN